MSIKSTNLNLNLTDTASETTTDFQAWHRALDGTGYDAPSNMEIIDEFAAETRAALESKVPNSYGQDQANKVLATDENGNVVLKKSTGGESSGGATIDEEEISALIDKKVKLFVATSENDFGGITYIFDVASENVKSKEEIEIES